MAELGRVERPSVEEFRGSERKLYLVPTIYKGGEDPPAEYLQKYGQYWQEVETQLIYLQARVGKIKRVYHELVFEGGEEGLNRVERLCKESYEVIKKCCEGAQFEALEDRESLEESMDWSRCLAAGLRSPKVASQVYQFYEEANRKRFERMEKRIDESLGPQEVGALFIAENHRVQFPKDIQVIYVAPRTLDEIHRWLRGQVKAEPGP